MESTKSYLEQIAMARITGIPRCCSAALISGLSRLYTADAVKERLDIARGIGGLYGRKVLFAIVDTRAQKQVARSLRANGFKTIFSYTGNHGPISVMALKL